MIKDIIENNENVLPNTKEMEILKKHFPSCFDSDGVFDLERFKEHLTDKVITKNEGYELKFLGKNYARLISSLDTTTVIVPDEEHNNKAENKDSENIYISGDNIDGLKHLLKSYENKVKCIYIDPPYNTGSDQFVYNDSFNFSVEELCTKLSVDETQAERILELTTKGSASHSAWLMFMYPRLFLARDLLKDDGVIFISIDDNEQANLKLLCDDVFGEENFVTNIHIELSTTQGMKVKAAKDGNIVKNAEYVLCYSKDGHKNIATNSALYDYRPKYDEHYSLYKKANGKIVQLTELYNYRFPNDCRNKKPYKLAEAFAISKEFADIVRTHYADIVRTHYADIVRTDKITGIDITADLKNGYWKEVEKDGRTYLLTKDAKGKVKQLLRLSDSWGQTDGYYNEVGLRKVRGNWWKDFYIDMGNVSKEGNVTFANGKKPVRLIKQLSKMCTSSCDFILDFFSGSATTAHAVMQLNAEDDGNRKFIMVQLPEQTDEDSEARKNGYETIDQIGMERITRAAKQIKEQYPDTAADLGFKHYTLQEPDPNTLDKLENFVLDEQGLVNDNDVLSCFGLPTVLTTWLVHDGYGFNADVQAIDFEGYTGYYIDKHLYLIDENITTEAISAILDKFELESSFNPENVVLFGYSFVWTKTEELKINLQRLSTTAKNLRVNLDIRY